MRVFLGFSTGYVFTAFLAEVLHSFILRVLFLIDSVCVLRYVTVCARVQVYTVHTCLINFCLNKTILLRHLNQKKEETKKKVKEKASIIPTLFRFF